jgi:positive phototaxis protein PixI
MPIPEDTRQRFLRFQLANEHGALLPLADVVEILKLDISVILPIPDVPAWILGVCNWRGEMIWLVDVNRVIDGMPLWQQSPSLDRPMVIVVESKGYSMGLVVEQVNDVELISPETILQLTELDTHLSGSLVMGHLSNHGGIVLDVDMIVEKSLQMSA